MALGRRFKKNNRVIVYKAYSYCFWNKSYCKTMSPQHFSKNKLKKTIFKKTSQQPERIRIQI